MENQSHNKPNSQQDEIEPTIDECIDYICKSIVSNWKLWIAIMILQAITKFL